MTRVAKAAGAWAALRGSRVLLPPGCEQPDGLLAALADISDGSIEHGFFGGILTGGYEFLDDAPESIRLTIWQLPTESRDPRDGDRFKLLPTRYSQLTRLFAPAPDSLSMPSVLRLLRRRRLGIRHRWLGEAQCHLARYCSVQRDWKVES